jgi:hypothetical protein
MTIVWRALGCSVLALAVGVASAQAAPQAQPEAQPSKWVQKELKFVYQGFTTHYSCDGLSSKIRDVLLQLGARPDLKVYEMACTTSAGVPSPFPGVNAKFSVLVPAQPQDAGAPVAAHWGVVQVQLGNWGLDHAGQCELLEQIKQSILPLFTTRNVDFKQSCIPHHLTVQGSMLAVQILQADKPKALVSTTN